MPRSSFSRPPHPPEPPPFPTRRSSDLFGQVADFWTDPGTGQYSAKLPKRSEEHTSELQSRGHLVCRLLLEKKEHRSNKRDRQKVIDHLWNKDTDANRQLTIDMYAGDSA